MNNKKEFKLTYGDKEITVETGRLAKQADGAVLVTCGGTQVLVTVCASREVASGQDFFPLMVDYKEKFYAGGKFLGGFMKREGRPSNSEILLMRMIDRPLRPLFPEGFFNETIITAQVLSYDESSDPEILAGLGASASLMVSDIPFLEPAGFCKVGKVNGQFVLNPNAETLKQSTIDIIVAASEGAILMVEGEANEVSEQEMLDAINFAHTNIKQFCSMLKKMAKDLGVVKREFTPIIPNKTLMEKVKLTCLDQAKQCLAINDKTARSLATSNLTKKIGELLKANPADFGLADGVDFGKQSAAATDYLLYDLMRKDILLNEKRIGGRKIDQVRPIEVEVDVLKTPHGSALFTRGETQVLSTITLGGKDGDQMADRLAGISYDKFYLHYNFLPFSVGEARGYRGVGRREVGHGNLAERALKKVLPADYSYTIRVACEVLESNGSSSMGSVCAGCMALQDAGVPITAPVAGIAMGLIKEDDKFKILTDILGDEDHLGDMDFKVAGTEKGITAIQMDIKIAGINEQIMTQALTQAKVGRIHILKEMSKAIVHSRDEYKTNVPLIQSLKIKPDQIGAVIGPGGKNIKGIQEKYGVTIECSDDGTVRVIGKGKQKVSEVINLIELQINGPKEGAEYDAVVVTIKEYGAFVDIAGGISGLVHVSEMANERVQDVYDYVTEGDVVKVKVMEVDRFGKIKFSIRAIKPLENKNPNKKVAPSVKGSDQTTDNSEHKR